MRLVRFVVTMWMANFGCSYVSLIVFAFFICNTNVDPDSLAPYSPIILVFYAPIVGAFYGSLLTVAALLIVIVIALIRRRRSLDPSLRCLYLAPILTTIGAILFVLLRHGHYGTCRPI